MMSKDLLQPILRDHRCGWDVKRSIMIKFSPVVDAWLVVDSIVVDSDCVVGPLSVVAWLVWTEDAVVTSGVVVSVASSIWIVAGNRLDSCHIQCNAIYASA